MQGGQHGPSLTAPGLTVASPVHADCLLLVEGHCAGAADLDGQQDFAGFSSLTAPGLAVSSACVALAADGSVYTAGDFLGTVDFDPGAGTFNLTSAGDRDIYISKLNAEGNFVWARSMGGTDEDIFHGIAVAADGSVHTTGWFKGTADFDPGDGMQTLASAGNTKDIFVSKLDSEGEFVWARGMGAGGSVAWSGCASKPIQMAPLAPPSK